MARVTAHPRYRLRGDRGKPQYNNHPTAAWTPPARSAISAEQRLWNRLARSVSGKWPITRANKSSRGLERGYNNTCYRLASLQVLFHLPKFMNLVLQHTPGDKCLTRGRACMACVLKPAIRQYWGRHNLNAAGEPQPLPHDLGPIHETHIVAVKFFDNEDQNDGEEWFKIMLTDCDEVFEHM
jgi:hypothetical protein